MGHSFGTVDFLMKSRLRDAARGRPEAFYELGVAFAAGADGVDVDLIEAHKWFNLAAVHGSLRAQQSRAEIAEDMTAREIMEAQRQARAWIAAGERRVA